jgi:hypothetical protein
MITFTNLYTRTSNILGLQSSNAIDLANAKIDINQALRIFKNASRRYWTRAEKSTNLVAGQQYYSLPPDCVRVTEVRVNSNGLNFPLEVIDSEQIWNKLNIIPATTINLPRNYFIRGRDEIGLWPQPSQNTTNGLIISYEPRLPDMTIDDVTDETSGATMTVTNGSTTITASSGIFVPQMVGRWFQIDDGTDGSWYQLATYNSSTSFSLANSYQGISGSGRSFIIGQAPDIPEDYHMGLVYYAAYQYYLKRNDQATATTYKALYEDLLNQYKKVYAVKTTGQVRNMMADYRYNLFFLPPGIIT